MDILSGGPMFQISTPLIIEFFRILTWVSSLSSAALSKQRTGLPPDFLKI